MEPIEIIVIVVTVLFLGAVVYTSIQGKKKGKSGCASQYGCSAVSDMQRAFKDAKKSFDNDKNRNCCGS
ncbi:MAG: hypothetical protein WC399_05085 [Bacilli bacterium]|jgi:hypothetical protein